MESEQKRDLLKIIVSAALLAAACLIPADGWMKAVLFIVPFALAGMEVLIKAAKNIFHGEIFDENFLMSIATIGAFATGQYPEAVAVMLFYDVGELFEDIAVGKSRRSISALMNIKPDHARVLRGGQESVVAPEQVEVGETIAVRPGEKIPLDGVACGPTTVDTSALTGESAPRDVAKGDNVVSGSVNLGELIEIKVTSVYGESTVAKILDLVENSASKKAKTENFITRFARYYTPCVVGAAVLLALVPPLLFAQSFNVWFGRALIFLVVSCPCALVISVPLSFFGGIGGASRAGILIKGSNYLEALSKVDTVVFDKTGTLTRGSLAVTAVHPHDISEAELLDIAALAESFSNHPIAASIVRGHSGHIDKARISKIEELPGLGVRAVIDGRIVFAGNGKLMDRAGAQWHECHIPGTVVHISVGEDYCGHIVISDELKPDAAEAISALKRQGVTKTVMLTGDVRAVAEAVAAKTGVDEVRAELLPDGKSGRGRGTPGRKTRPERTAGVRRRRYKRRAGTFPRRRWHRYGRARKRCRDRGGRRSADGRQPVEAAVRDKNIEKNDEHSTRKHRPRARDKGGRARARGGRTGEHVDGGVRGRGRDDNSGAQRDPRAQSGERRAFAAGGVRRGKARSLGEKARPIIFTRPAQNSARRAGKCYTVTIKKRRPRFFLRAAEKVP
jgi:Cd2+/Zn2+-exporting ATPase